MTERIRAQLAHLPENLEGKIITDIIPINPYDEEKTDWTKPCPKDARGMNEWVLNHLPLFKNEQKEKFLNDLKKDQHIVEKKEKDDITKKKLAQRKKECPKLVRTYSRKLSVKETTKKVS